MGPSTFIDGDSAERSALRKRRSGFNGAVDLHRRRHPACRSRMHRSCASMGQSTSIDGDHCSTCRSRLRTVGGFNGAVDLHRRRQSLDLPYRVQL